MNRREAVLAMMAVPALSVAADSGAMELIKVYKTESCGCCKLWVSHLQQAGFAVEVENLADLGPIKQRVGLPYGLGSCHTAEVGGYFIEGHVPAQDVKRLLRERPAARGLTVPGMPLGSPGMEVPSGEVQPYDVLLVDKDGNASVFSQYGK
jgi:hypothetical protein